MEDSKENYCCPNCMTVLPGEAKFCPSCGQKRIHAKDFSVIHLIAESVGDFFHFDSKFIGTLRPLLTRPGFLTNEYLAGKRARYFQPFKLFLFISFLYFLTSGIVHHYRHPEGLRVTGSVLQARNGIVTQENAAPMSLSLGPDYDKIIQMPEDSLKRVVSKYGLNRFVDQRFPGSSWLHRFLVKQSVKNRIQGSATFNENMKKTIPKLIFLLIPFFALLLKLLYIRKKIPFFSHSIFSLHFLSFVFLLLWINMFASMITGWSDVAVNLLILGYLFMALLRVYHQRKWATFGKFVMLLSGSLVILLVFLFLLVSISFMMI